MMASSDTASHCYYLVPNLRALDPSARELDPEAHAWVQPIIIDDDDLTFGGKPLSAWYEEERRRHSASSGSGSGSGAGSGSSASSSDDGHQSGHVNDEEHRGRERTRRQHSEKGRHHR
ncbi:hypothetical protein XA68_17898 [Ophiocordyceps unilateralis]|uniref:Uncharacterized protein n=1 Tax=Ophiocordyceps unilateralis TaxID=268505 RepID=A0A2A9P2J2_OPHUN|nr:hypothetical protein XA68_17898 [Ophiocordyceps unilateralis]